MGYDRCVAICNRRSAMSGEQIEFLSALRQLLQQNSLDGVRTLEHISAVSLIELNRDNHRYEWREIGKVGLGMEH